MTKAIGLDFRNQELPVIVRAVNPVRGDFAAVIIQRDAVRGCDYELRARKRLFRHGVQFADADGAEARIEEDGRKLA